MTAMTWASKSRVLQCGFWLGCGCSRGSESVDAADSTGSGGIWLPDTSESGAQLRLDLPSEEPLGLGCTAVDLLFVLDNSASMHTHHEALAEAFPGFITAIFEQLPPGTEVHVGLTTTDVACKGPECPCIDATIGCQSAAEAEAILAVYDPPSMGSNGVNGSQGRLIVSDGLPYFAVKTTEDPAPLIAWFAAAANGAGELGCSFEMPAAAAGLVADPANMGANSGFIRDAGSALVLFVLTDEPDKSPGPIEGYVEQLRVAKQACGGDTCITAAAILPACVAAGQQSLWRFLSAFGEAPIWGDIADPGSYVKIAEDALIGAVTRTCATVPVP